MYLAKISRQLLIARVLDWNVHVAPPSVPERFYWEKERHCILKLPFPHPQHLAEGLHDPWSEEA